MLHHFPFLQFLLLLTLQLLVVVPHLRRRPLPRALSNLLDLRLNLVRFLPVADGLVERDDVVLDVARLVPSPSL